jgi:hypothetical protein
MKRIVSREIREIMENGGECTQDLAGREGFGPSNIKLIIALSRV